MAALERAIHPRWSLATCESRRLRIDSLPVLAGFEQPTAGFAAGELVNLWYSVAGDNVQSMSAKLWIGL